MRKTLCALLLPACGMWYLLEFPAPPIRGWAEEGLDAVIAEWSADETLPPYNDVCRRQRRDLRYTELEGRDFERACYYCAGTTEALCSCPQGCAAGCRSSNDGLKGSVRPQIRTIVFVASLGFPEARRRRLIVHEGIHWLEACTGLGSESVYTPCEDDRVRGHCDPRRWKSKLHPTEGVEGRAFQRLAAQGWNL